MIPSWRIGRPWGVLLLNMGGPESLEAVEPYLARLFADRRMIRLPGGRFYQTALARLIAHWRAPQAAERYRLIGGKSPIAEETARQAAELERLLGAPVGFAFRYSDPGVETALAALACRRIENLIALPMFPQYSGGTSGSAIADFIEHNKLPLPYAVIERHFDNEGYLESLAAGCRAALAQLSPDSPAHLLFTAHSIPEKYTRGGDPYVAETQTTAELVSQRLRGTVPTSLAFQSKLGPVKWHGPSLDEELRRLRAAGVRQLVAAPLSFVTENLETLYDLDIVLRRSCLDSGIERLVRVPAVGAAAQYIAGLASLIRRTVEAMEHPAVK